MLDLEKEHGWGGRGEKDHEQTKGRGGGPCTSGWCRSEGGSVRVVERREVGMAAYVFEIDPTALKRRPETLSD
jgi:hypothetical protein